MLTNPLQISLDATSSVTAAAAFEAVWLHRLKPNRGSKVLMYWGCTINHFYMLHCHMLVWPPLKFRPSSATDWDVKVLNR
jgi:hypothetical protein